MAMDDGVQGLARRTTILEPERAIGAPPRRHTLGQDHDQPASGYARRRTSWALDAESIIEKCQSNRTFKVGIDFDPTGLPVLGDLTPYGIPERKRDELCALEIRRLVKGINAATPALLEGDPLWFGQADRDGYTQLANLAEQMLLAHAIFMHDHEFDMLRHFPNLATPSSLQGSRQKLLCRFGPDAPKAPGDMLAALRTEAHNDEAVHCIVNYVTLTVAQVLMRTMHGGFWDDNCVIALARWAAKIKALLAVGLDHAAETCLATRRSWTEHMKSIMAKDPEPQPPANTDNRRTPAEKQRAAMARIIVERSYRYFMTMSVGACVAELANGIIEVLSWDRDAAQSPDTFELCSVVYDTGFRGKRSILCQGRNGGIGVSGHRDEIHCASFVLDTCKSAFRALQGRLGPEATPVSASSRPPTSKETGVSSDPGPSTLVYWKWTELQPEPSDFSMPESSMFKGAAQSGELRLTSMLDVISALVPLSTVAGRFISELETMTLLAAAPSGSGDPIVKCAETRSLASFMMQTSSYASYRKAFKAEPTVTPVSVCPLAEQGALAQGPMSTPQNRAMPDHRLRDQLSRKSREIGRALDIVDQFTFDASSIMIWSRWYCWGTLLCGGVLVLAGLAIGLTVQERIRGVDPFNISIFCWAVAGFFIVFMKSLRVENWPWRDFFLGRVVCRSASEVATVSGIAPQLLLSVFLRLEPTVMLNKEGPFRAAFTRKDPNAQGLIMDIPLHRASLMDGGCFFVQVQGGAGPALVCIRSSVFQSYNSVSSRGVTSKAGEVSCRTLREPGIWGRGESQRHMHRLSTDEFVWSSVSGIYWGDTYFC